LVCGSAKWRQRLHVNWLLAALFSALPFAAIADDDVVTNSPDLLADTLAPEQISAKIASWEFTPGFDTGVEHTNNVNWDDTLLPVTFFAHGLRLKLKGDIEGTEIAIRAREKLLLPINEDRSYRNLTSRLSVSVKHPLTEATTLYWDAAFGTYQDGVSPASQKSRKLL